MVYAYITHGHRLGVTNIKKKILVLPNQKKKKNVPENQFILWCLLVNINAYTVTVTDGIN